MTPFRHRRLAAPAFVAVNAIAFLVLRPGVPDLWAARARASAAGHGVGLTYWFGWFGGSTPGNYSVLTPSLCSAAGVEPVAAVAAMSAAVLVTSLLRDTPRATSAALVAAFCITVNLWCGRVPFLLGAAFGVAALCQVRNRRPVAAGALAVLTVLASPVAGAFLALGLSGAVLTRRATSHRAVAASHRAVALLTAGAAGVTLLSLALLFGAPGPEPLPPYLLGEIVLVLGLLLLSEPPPHLRTSLWIAAAAAVVLSAVPNGMGSNLARLALFCLPPAAVALSRRGTVVLAALMAPVLVLGALDAGSAVRSALRPGSTAAYYAPLAAELDGLGNPNHRLEVVDAGHAAYAVLLDHAVLARGWETQEDDAHNGVLHSTSLDGPAYRAWLDDNAVGYVALNTPAPSTPEARTVRTAAYLRPVWRSADWQLFRVTGARSIVAGPAVLEASTQSQLTVHVPCACRTSVRVRWSDLLGVTPRLPADTPDAVEDGYRPTLGRTRLGWTTLVTNRPGTYVMG